MEQHQHVAYSISMAYGAKRSIAAARRHYQSTQHGISWHHRQRASWRGGSINGGSISWRLRKYQAEHRSVA